MKIHLINNYKKEVPAQFEGYFDTDNLKNYLEEEILKYHKFQEIDDEIIKDEIIDFIQSDASMDIVLFNEEDVPTLHCLEYREDFEILNLEELISHFSYLKRLAARSSCCDYAIGNYCSVCGTKLK